MRYALRSLVWHSGSTAHFGHYQADVLEKSGGAWKRFDDDDVRHVSEAAVLGDAARTNGYLLFYEAYEAVM